MSTLLVVWQRGESNPAWAPGAAPGRCRVPCRGVHRNAAELTVAGAGSAGAGANGPRSPCRSAGLAVAARCREVAGSVRRRGPAVVPVGRGHVSSEKVEGGGGG